jgi:D-mannonate dehydratase
VFREDKKRGITRDERCQAKDGDRKKKREGKERGRKIRKMRKTNDAKRCYNMMMMMGWERTGIVVMGNEGDAPLLALVRGQAETV